jgi:hypothetical protein
MSIGVKYEMRVYAKGDARPRNPGGIGYASIKEPVTPLPVDRTVGILKKYGAVTTREH